jgi:hypothetical protein
MAITPKTSWPWVRTLLHSVYDQPDTESVAAQYDRIINALADKLPKVADRLYAAPHRLAALPKQNLAPNMVQQPQERLNNDIRRAYAVVGILLGRAAPIRSSAPSWPNNATNGLKPGPDSTLLSRSSGRLRNCCGLCRATVSPRNAYQTKHERQGLDVNCWVGA